MKNKFFFVISLAEFSQLHFTSDWATVKTTFITKYSLPFIENKKKEMSFTFSDEPNLRSFVNRKFATFKKYTTLPFTNQMEIILNDLPTDIAHLFMVNEKFDCDENDILEYCDAIQELVEKHIEDKNSQISVTEPLNRMEEFRYETDDAEVMDAESLSPRAGPRTGRVVRGRGGRGRGGRDSKVRRASTGSIGKHQLGKRKLNPIPEDAEYDFLDQVSNSSQSSYSSRSSGSSFMSLRNGRKKYDLRDLN